MIDRALVGVEDQARLAAYNIFSAVMRRTPVRSGKFVANWNVTTRLADYHYTDNTDVGRAIEQLESLFTLPFGNFFIANGLPYGHALEYEGLSKQAPQGMIRVSLAEAPMHIANAREGRVS